MRYFPEEGSTVRGLRGTSYVLGPRIGRGGQGAVWEDATGAWAIKIYGQATPERQALRRRRLEQVVARRVQSDVLIVPTELLAAPWVGYAMPLVKGFRPVKSLIFPAPGEDALAHYHATGGPRVRYALLERLTAAFHAIHAAGLAYGDLSLDNLLVREDGRPDIRLIDCDNLVPAGSELVEVEGTPWFVAPEILRRRQAPSERTDAHALAVLIQLTLSMRHPLLGDAVTAGPPEEEERALRGDLPWVDDPEDASNRSTVGLPASLSWTTGIGLALARAFGPGRLDATVRPTDLAWLELLGTARDSLVTCGAAPCRSEFTLRSRCPYCNERRPRVPFLVFHRTGPDGEAEQRPVVLNTPTGLRARHLVHGRSLPSEILVEASPQPDGSVALVNRSADALVVKVERDREVLVPPGQGHLLQHKEWFQMGAHGVRGELRR